MTFFRTHRVGRRVGVQRVSADGKRAGARGAPREEAPVEELFRERGHRSIRSQVCSQHAPHMPCMHALHTPQLTTHHPCIPHHTRPPFNSITGLFVNQHSYNTHHTRHACTHDIHHNVISLLCRVLATATLTGASVTWVLSRRLPLPPRARLAVNCLGVVTVLQYTLGIATLLSIVHTHVAATHQAGSLTLLSVAVWLVHELRKVKGLRK